MAAVEAVSGRDNYPSDDLPDVPPPRPPRGLSSAGKRLWRAAVADHDFDVHEQMLLLQACRCVDHLDRLAAEAAEGSVTVTNFKGDQVANPAMVEARQQSLVLARLLASLRMPSGDEEAARPQRRGAARGAYGVRGVA